MSTPAAHGPVPSLRQMAWHQRPLYGFIHFGLNTFTDREWGRGDEDPALFDPADLDCRQWVEAAKAGGLKALILTAKHHDGFCLWPTATTPHNVGRSPFRDGAGDVVRELAEACGEGGLGFGIYCSPWDRNHPAYGQDGYVEVYHAQLRELLTGYGELCELWLDGANGGSGYYGGAWEERRIDPKTYYHLDAIHAMCRELQPGAMLFSDTGPDLRWVGNERGVGGFTNWAKVCPEGFYLGGSDDAARFPAGDADGTVWRPAEVDVSIRPGWFWHPTEQPRSGTELFEIWLSSVGRNAFLLLNLAPDRRGRIPEEDVVELTRFRAEVESFEAVDLARGSPVEATSTGAGDPVHLVDGDPQSWWASDERTAALTVDLGAAHALAGIRLEEAIAFGQRVERFSVEVRTCGDHWTEMAQGTTIGSQRILPLRPVAGDAVRVRILAAQAPPVLGRIGISAGT